MNLLLKIVFLCTFCTCYCDRQKSYNSSIQSNSKYIPKYDQVCTNECSDADDHYWCGKIKEDAKGRAMKCVQYTQYGDPCVAECGGKKEYTWCLTNANIIGKEKVWWDYCSLSGYTINRKPCHDTCAKKGENYFWCHNDKNDMSKWDYCSPQGRVKPLQYTTHKVEPCISECSQGEENYYWCTKSMDHCNDDACDTYWGYCSLDSQHTRYNYKCTNGCGMYGETYYWCKTKDGVGNWDYCSQEPSLLVHVNGKIELTRYGEKCRDKCSTWGESYFWCAQYGQKKENDWDYCSPSPSITINSADCKNSCLTRGENYYWCNTEASWDYCSPAYEDKGLGYENVKLSCSKSLDSNFFIVLYFLITLLK